MIPIKISDITIINKHYDAIKKVLDMNIKRKKYLSYNYIDIDNWVKKLTNDKYNLEGLIKAEATELKKIIDIITKNPKYNGNDKSKCNHKGSDYSINQFFLYVYSKFSKNGDCHFKNAGYDALQLSSDLDINVCPYCNRNFISRAKKKSTNGKEVIIRTAQLDHFYPESEFPFLALSFYNLIPVCPTCNKIKLVERFGVNPYTINNSDEHIIFDYDFNGSIKDIKVDTIYRSTAFEINWNALGLEELYQAHNNYLSDLFIRIKIYNSLYRSDLSKYVKGLSGEKDMGISEITVDDIKRAILGNYFNETDLNKHPLSKLTKDIVRQYL